MNDDDLEFFMFDYKYVGNNDTRTRWYAFALLCAIVLASLVVRLLGLWPGWAAWLEALVKCAAQ